MHVNLTFELCKQMVCLSNIQVWFLLVNYSVVSLALCCPNISLVHYLGINFHCGLSMEVTDGHTKQDFVIFAILVCSKFFVICSSLYFVTIGNKEGSPSNAVI